MSNQTSDCTRRSAIAALAASAAAPSAVAAAPHPDAELIRLAREGWNIRAQMLANRRDAPTLHELYDALLEVASQMQRLPADTPAGLGAKLTVIREYFDERRPEDPDPYGMLSNLMADIMRLAGDLEGAARDLPHVSIPIEVRDHSGSA